MKKVIKASAGTGKTYRLALEYLAALLKRIDFTEIIVMTFTKKATAEIKQRIFNQLKIIINDKPEKDNLLTSLKEVYPELKVDTKLLSRVYKKMLLNEEEIKIYTIDAFTNQIFKRGIAPYLAIYNYQIIDDSQNEEIIEDVLKIILNNQTYYKKMQDFLAANPARDLKKYLDFIQQIVNNSWQFLLLKSQSKAELVADNDLVELFEKSYHVLEKVAELREEELTAAYFVKAGRTFFENYSDLETKTEKQEFLYQRRNYLLQESYWSGNKLRAKKTADLKEKLQAEYDLFRRQLAREIYNREVIPAEKDIIDFAELILNIYENIKFKRALFTHADISNYTFKYLNDEAIALVKDGQVSDYLLDLLGGDYQTLLIDEFQDTSILQWKILQPLIKRAAIFIAVGDEKQSIYGWRGGEKNLFANLDKIIGAETERLNCCYRSDQQIIELLNNFFAEIEQDWEYHPVKANSTESGLTKVLYGGDSAYYNTATKKFAALTEEKQVNIKQLNSYIKSDLAAEIAVDIKENYADDYGRVSILARTAKELNTIANCLAQSDIPYILENRASILEAQLPAALVSLLKFIAYRDFYQLLKFLRSDLIRINNQQLKLILQHKVELEYYLNSSLAAVELPSAIQDNIVLNSLFTEIKSLFELDYRALITYLYQKTELIELATDGLALKNLYTFFVILNSFDSLKNVLNYLAENKDSEELKQTRVENKDAVTLMTIHQAKGLSLPVEYFYWNPGRRSGNNQSSLNFYLEFDEKYDQLTNYLLIQDQYLPILDWLDYDFKDQAEKKAELEEVNNLYVALSRVEKELHIFIEAPRTIKPDQQLMWSGSNYDYYEKMLLKATGVKNLLELITPWQKGSIVKVESEKFTQPQPLIDLNKYLSQTAANQSLLQQQQEEKYRFFRAKNNELELSEKRLSGLALHYYLENIKYNQPAEKITARKLVNNKYGNLLGKEKINSLIEQGERFISSNKDLFEQDKQIFTEYLLKEKTAQSVKKYRIDRLIVDQFQQKIKIIDYKSGSYRDPEQLLKYKKLLQNQLAQNWEIETEFLNI